MKRALTLLIVSSLLLSLGPSVFAASGEAGVDANPGDDVPFTVSDRTTPSQDGAVWSLSITLDQESQDNGTVLAISTQICLNSGVCDPPINHEATLNEGTYSMELTPPGDHSYVNWRVKATYDDESTETFPEGDWYKTWSSCYYDDGTYSGIHADGDGCNVPSSEEPSSALPAIGMALVIGVIGVGVIAARRS